MRKLFPVKIEYFAIVAAEDPSSIFTDSVRGEIELHQNPDVFVGKEIKKFKGSNYEEWENLIPFGDNDDCITCKEILGEECNEAKKALLEKLNLTEEEIRVLGIEI